MSQKASAGKNGIRIPKSTRFEDALGELETLVRELESNENSLDESLARFERGIALARFCNQSLDDAEQKVKVLVGDDQNSEELIDFAGNDDGHGERD